MSDDASKATAVTPASHVPENAEPSANKEHKGTDTDASIRSKGPEQSSAEAMAAEADAYVAYMFRNSRDPVPPRLPGKRFGWFPSLVL